MIRSSLRFVSIAVATAIPFATTSAQIAVGTAVHISSAHPTRSFYEYLSAADPDHPKRLMVCTMSLAPEKSAKWVVLYSSFDGGETWKPTIEDKRTDWVGDPTCQYGRGDTAYFSTLPIFGGPKGHGSEMTLYRSLNGGRTWGDPLLMPFIDRQYINVDRTRDRFAGRVYIHANGSFKSADGKSSHPQPQILRSVDGGASFQGPVGLDSADFYSLAIPGDGGMFSDGTLIFPLWGGRKGETQQSLEVMWTDDGGLSLSHPVIVAKHDKDCGGLPRLVIDPTDGPFSNRVYVAYMDKDLDNCVVKVATSSDRGRTWTPGRTVSDAVPPADGKREDAFLPSVAVNNNGVVGVVWYDRRDYPDNIGHALRFAASFDGGASYTRSVAVSKFGLDLSKQPTLPFHTYTRGGNAQGNLESIIGIDESYMGGQGDTQGFVVDGEGVFHPFWIDNRTGTPQMFTTTVKVAGKAVMNGDASLASLPDITSSVTLTYGHTTFDTRSRTISLQVIVRNLSERPIAGPLKLRAVGLRSTGGTAVVLNADNHLSGPGAIWDLTKAIPGKELAPNAETKPVTLTFRLEGYSLAKLDRRLGGSYIGRGLDLESRVYGTPK